MKTLTAKTKSGKTMTVAKEQAEKAMGAEIIKYIYKMGCDAADVRRFEYDFDKNITWNSKAARIATDKELANALPYDDVVALAKKHGAKELEADGMSYGGYEFSGEALEAFLSAARKKISNKQEADKKLNEENEAAERAILENIQSVQVEKPQHIGDGEESVILACITVTHKSGKTFDFKARNIFDFGLVLNPPGGGIAIEVEGFIKHNRRTFETDEEKAKYRASHPTETGWGWMADQWREMKIEEVESYKAAHQAAVKAGLGGMRM